MIILMIKTIVTSLVIIVANTHIVFILCQSIVLILLSALDVGTVLSHFTSEKMELFRT